MYLSSWQHNLQILLEYVIKLILHMTTWTFKHYIFILISIFAFANDIILLAFFRGFFFFSVQTWHYKKNNK